MLGNVGVIETGLFLGTLLLLRKLVLTTRRGWREPHKDH
jgi:hypothetical protein